MEIEHFALTDDGIIPNHAHYPLLLYRGAFIRGDQPHTTDEAIATFAANGWQGAWINGIFPFHHYHARAHEVLANLGSPVTVQFGGTKGPTVEFATGDVVVIPAGGGHCRKTDTAELIIVGAYPRGQENWDLKREAAADYRRAKQEIPLVARPAADPVTGTASPLLDFWT